MKLELVREAQVQPMGDGTFQTMFHFLVKLDGKIISGSPTEELSRKLYDEVKSKLDTLKPEVLASEEV
jgi:hypothetical protein